MIGFDFPNALPRAYAAAAGIAAFPAWLEALGTPPVEWDASIHRRVESGFSDDRNGEDEFDAAIGLLAMIAVVTGALDACVPADDPAVLNAEGWILGRAADRPALQP
jgi:hypothetical protein